MVLTTYKIVILDAQIDYEHSEKIKCHKTNSFRRDKRIFLFTNQALFSPGGNFYRNFFLKISLF